MGAAAYPPDGGVLVNLSDIPMETFDSAEDFEMHEPEEWVELCSQNSSRPQACVLHYVARVWTMLPCWVLGYEAQAKRYLVELEDGSRKRVKRLALRFNAEDPANFARRVETCQAKKAHCELQKAFIAFIEGQDVLVSPMLREHKELFIRQCLHKSHVQEAQNHIGTIRELILEIERSYMLCMKFAKVKDDLMETNTATPHVRESEFASLLTSFLPQPVPLLALVAHQPADQSVFYIADQLAKQPTLSEGTLHVTYAVWKRFDEVSRLRILDTSRRSRMDQRRGGVLKVQSGEKDPSLRVFDPDKFFQHMEDWRKDVTVMLERHWRDFIVSEVLDKMDGSNFFVDNAQRHQRSPLHRILQKLDLILNSQMRSFVQTSIDDWVSFMCSFRELSPPAPLLTLSLVALDGAVVLVPDPDELISKLMELMDGVTKVTAALSVIEHELVPFCNLVQKEMFEIDTDFEPLVEAKITTEEVVRHCLVGPQEIQAEYQKFAHLLLEEIQDLDPLDIDAMRDRIGAYMKAGTEIETLTATVMKFPFFELHCVDIIATLSSCAYQLAGVCKEAVNQSIQQRSTNVLLEWNDTHNRILSNPEDEEELAKLKQFMSDINQLKTKPLMTTTRHVHKQIDMLSDFSFGVDKVTVEKAFKSFAWPLQIQIDVCDSERSLDTQKQKFMDKLEQEKADFEKDMMRYEEDLEWLKGLNDYSVGKKHETKIDALKDNLDQAKVRVQSFVDREKLFNTQVSDYAELDEMMESFEPYYKLWTSAIGFKHSEEEWLNGSLSRLNAQEIDQVVEDQYKESYKMFKQFEGNNHPQGVAKDLETTSVLSGRTCQ